MNSTEHISLESLEEEEQNLLSESEPGGKEPKKLERRKSALKIPTSKSKRKKKRKISRRVSWRDSDGVSSLEEVRHIEARPKLPWACRLLLEHKILIVLAFFTTLAAVMIISLLIIWVVSETDIFN